MSPTPHSKLVRRHTAKRHSWRYSQEMPLAWRPFPLARGQFGPVSRFRGMGELVRALRHS
eukprot:scaffold3097_cov70-Phaeocystis_antarctica.AAC.1